MSTPTPTAVVGASGFAGVELVRMVLQHPRLQLSAVSAKGSAGQRVDQSWPQLSGLPVGEMQIEAVDAKALAAKAEIVLLALPHGVSAPIAAQLLKEGVQVVDMGADFRLPDAAQWEEVYGSPHAEPQLLGAAVNGLVELNRAALPGAQLIAAPGCYPTATTLAAAPAVRHLGVDWVISDCMSGVSGAGRKLSATTHYCAVNESVSAYAMGGVHRHSVEMERLLAPARVSFTPHLVPMTRGLLATVHMRPSQLPTQAQVTALYREFYADSPMVVWRDGPPGTDSVRGSARAHLHACVDQKRGVLSVSCAIDNLLKGAGAQGIQALNVARGWPETMGLPLFPVLP